MKFEPPKATMPLHMQNKSIQKAASNPSFESFRPNILHESTGMREMDRPGTASFSLMRRLNGELDYDAALAMIGEAASKAQANTVLNALEAAILTVIWPGKYSDMTQQQADIYTKLSSSEKSKLRELSNQMEREWLNWNAGYAGGSVMDRNVTRS